jgi:hypothetical protein
VGASAVAICFFLCLEFLVRLTASPVLDRNALPAIFSRQTVVEKKAQPPQNLPLDEGTGGDDL